MAWISASGQVVWTLDQHTVSQGSRTAEGEHIDTVILECPRGVSSDAVVDSVQQLATKPVVSPTFAWLVFNHYGTSDGSWRMLVSALLGRPSIPSITQALDGTTYHPIATFLSPQRAEHAQSFFSQGVKLYTPGSASHPLRWLGHIVGADRLSFASTAILTSRDENSGIPLLDSISGWLPDRYRKRPGEDLRLLGFRIRARGTLLLFAELRNSSDRIVAKFSLMTEANDALNNGFHIQKWLREVVGGSIRSAIPEPLTFVDQPDAYAGSVCLESMEEGVVAWKVNTGRRRWTIDHEALGFLEKLQSQTRQVKTCSSDMVRQLLDSAMQRARSYENSVGVLTTALSRLSECIRDFHLSKMVGFVAAHGDFGIGNVLVDKNDGSLISIVDWADGRRIEFPSVDPFNWLIQLKRDQDNLSFVGAVDELHSEILSGSLPIDPSFLVDGKSPRESTTAALHTAVYRYVDRGLTYPWSFLSDCGDPETVAKMLHRLADEWQSMDA